MGKILLDSEQVITYSNLKRLLVDNRRVAIVQPTGTGKSVIVLKYIQDYDDGRSLIVVPYITNVEDFKRKIEKFELDSDNIDVITYRTLLYDKFIFLKKYKNIILDQYQYAGAEITQCAILKLLDINKDANVIGTTATDIRYLDNQRNMTEEIFNGVMARNMTLAYAIANKLLPEFDYITGVYFNDEEAIVEEKLLEKYHDNMQEISSGNLKEYVYLVRSLKDVFLKARNINGILKNRIKADGKYFVFCENKEQMNEIIDKIKNKDLDWFLDIDEEPEIYSIYYGNSNGTNIKNLNGFLNSTSKHLKLLFNINMGSLGLHPDDINGIIMLRKTASPNVYIQQFGRALSVKCNNKTEIYDFVYNIGNDWIFNVFGDIREEINKSLSMGKTDVLNLDDIKIFSTIVKVKEIIDKIESIPKSKVNDLFMYNINLLYETGLIGTDIDLNLENVNSEYERLKVTEQIENFIENKYGTSDEMLDISQSICKFWTQKHREFKSGRLNLSAIELLQSVGFIEKRNRFNSHDMVIYNNFCKLLNDNKTNLRSNKVSDLPIDKQLFFVKKYVDKYYFRKRGQTFSLDDYIQTCVLALINAKNNYHDEYNYESFVNNEIRKELHNSYYSLKSNNELSIERMRIEDKDQGYEHVLDRCMHDDLLLCLDKLDDKKRNLILFKYGFIDGVSHTMEETGSWFDLPSYTINYHELKAFDILRKRYPTELKKIEDYYYESFIKTKSINKQTLSSYEINMNKFVEKMQLLLKNKCDEDLNITFGKYCRNGITVLGKKYNYSGYMRLIRECRLGLFEYVNTGNVRNPRHGESLLNFLQYIKPDVKDEMFLKKICFVESDLKRQEDSKMRLVKRKK